MSGPLHPASDVQDAQEQATANSAHPSPEADLNRPWDWIDAYQVDAISVMQALVLLYVLVALGIYFWP
jgi:hypothetical protein